MKRTVKPSFMILSLLMFIILSACATGANTQNTSAGSSDAAKKVRIGLTVPTLSNPFFVAMSKGAQEAASKFNAEVITVSADQDLAKQTAQIEDFITKKVDLILLSPFDSKGIAAAVAQAKAANIPVIAVDGFAEGGINTVVMSDNVMAGTLAGEYLAKRLNGKGQIVIMDGPPVSAVTDRIKGFEEVMKKYPEIKVISKQNGEGNREKALSVMENILQANKKIDAVFAINDPEGVGIKIAAEQAGRGGEFFIVGVDGAPDAVTALKEKKAFAATSAQFPNEMVVKAVELGLQIKEGKSIDSKVLIPVELITQENVEQYRGW
ncbi:ABC transporter substrate-binding protein [Paenibacillus mucilaginosus]|uniref:Ribose ABC superfamily ATP binding cassette transporter, binding protein n=1 Tax=Paenibacillus mucilaginosus (strain KNP414) TaxID=1036673 RepID=F8FRK9_PAEMK|nr:ABC transporter substrate-binding protein [Paenibacillus mucilaginosus]AEI40566.1 ribose ABC superfamily ATP binding cassette transporter, binding protein [Paenibacillus mucilaginosus KNP414]MCG7216300.1 ABC transporter substrate-binding protein [Paenibacillus mucilaginosus]WDM29724.1 ABC transporter substrate-binding protein [Paenibacillus mucilaginosus]